MDDVWNYSRERVIIVHMKTNKLIVLGAVVLGIAFLGIAAYYWVTPAESLLVFLPGFEAGSTHVHFTHGLASFILGVCVLIFAWFKSAPSIAPQSGDNVQ